MKNTTLFIIIAMILIAVVGFAFVNSKQNINGNIISNNQNSKVQIVKLSVSGSNYLFSPSEVKKGIPVRIEADIANMPGCSKSIVIPGLGIAKTFTASNNTLEFIPDKAGTFNMACSMNMYKGTFTVLESDGSKSSNVDTLSSSSSSGSCNMNNGGSCGCMG